jgi:cysteine-rich repeat protein
MMATTLRTTVSMLALLVLLVFWGCAEDGTLMCGDGVVGPFEQCDDGNLVDTDSCNSDCEIQSGSCGDGIVDPFEQCDDGNLVDGDGCDSDCKIESGSGILPTLASIQTIVFTPQCAVCHRAGGTGPMPLDTEDASYESLGNFPFSFTCAVRRVDPGNPDESCLVMKIEGSDLASGTEMPPPPTPPLSQEEIDAIRQWILDGAPR